MFLSLFLLFYNLIIYICSTDDPNDYPIVDQIQYSYLLYNKLFWFCTSSINIYNLIKNRALNIYVSWKK